MRENPVFKGESQSQIILRDFDAPVNVGTKYVQRLTSYLQVKLHFPQGYSFTQAINVCAFQQGMVSSVVRRGEEILSIRFSPCSKLIFKI